MTRTIGKSGSSQMSTLLVAKAARGLARTSSILIIRRVTGFHLEALAEAKFPSKTAGQGGVPLLESRVSLAG